MIEINKSPSADSRTAEEPPTVEVLTDSTKQHIEDVSKALNFVADQIKARGPIHDHTKIQDMENFCAALNSGHIKDTEWYNKHITEERHHLKSNVPKDVNLMDVIEHVCDCTMAGLARSGQVYDVDIDPQVLKLAVKNTVDLLINNTKVSESKVDPSADILDQKI